MSETRTPPTLCPHVDDVAVDPRPRVVGLAGPRDASARPVRRRDDAEDRVVETVVARALLPDDRSTEVDDAIHGVLNGRKGEPGWTRI